MRRALLLPLLMVVMGLFWIILSAVRESPRMSKGVPVEPWIDIAAGVLSVGLGVYLLWTLRPWKSD